MAYCSHWETASITWSVPEPREDTYNFYVLEGRVQYLVEEGNVEGEAESVLQSDFVRQLGAEFPRGGGRVGTEGFDCPVHECHREDDGLLGFVGLELNITGRLVSRPVLDCSPKALLNVGGVPRAGRALLPDETEQVLDESVGGGEAADTERQEDPASGGRQFRGILRQLLTELAVDLVSERVSFLYSKKNYLKSSLKMPSPIM